MIMPSTNKKSLLLFQNVCVLLIFLFMALPKITNSMLSRSVERNHPFFVPKLSRKVIHSFAIRSVKERKPISFSLASLYKVEEVPTYLRVFIRVNVVFC